MKNDLSTTLLTEEQIQERIKELGRQITEDYKGKDLLVVCILKGAVLFYADLCRAIDLPISMDFMSVSSYGSGTRSSGVVRILKDLSSPAEGMDILLVEDILDSGNTLSYLRKTLLNRNPASLKICTLLDKPDRRDPNNSITVDYAGFDIPDEFVVGYGLDYNEKYRNLPYIGVLDRKIYE